MSQSKDGNVNSSSGSTTTANSFGISSSILNGFPAVVSRSNNNIVGNSVVGGTDSCNSLDDILGNVLGKLKQNMHTPEFSTIEGRIDKFVSDVVTPFLSQNLYAMGAGLFLGAAIISGLVVGTALSAGILYQRYYNSQQITDTNSASSERRGIFSLLPSSRKKVTTAKTIDLRKVIEKDLLFHTRNEGTQSAVARNNDDTSSTSNNNSSSTSSVNLGVATLHFIRGDVKSSQSFSVSQEKIASTQCRECFESIEASLSKLNLSWSDVRKMTVYLVTGKCDVSALRAAQVEYPIPNDHVLTSLLFVQQLEIPSAVVQIEVIATSSDAVPPNLT